MDKAKVIEIARRHQQVLTASALPDVSAGTLSNEDIFRRDIDSIWSRLADECKEFCSTYNDVMQTHYLYCDVHSDTIVVRWSKDLQDTLTFSRTPGIALHGGHIESHRYSSHAPNERLPVSCRIADGALRLTYEGRDISAEDLVLLLLARFTDQLTRERERASGP